MKVQKLIELLQKYPADANLRVMNIAIETIDGDCPSFPINAVQAHTSTELETYVLIHFEDSQYIRDEHNITLR